MDDGPDAVAGVVDSAVSLGAPFGSVIVMALTSG